MDPVLAASAVSRAETEKEPLLGRPDFSRAETEKDSFLARPRFSRAETEHGPFSGPPASEARGGGGAISPSKLQERTASEKETARSRIWDLPYINVE